MKNDYQDLSKFEVPSGFRGRSRLYVQLWWLIQATIFGLSPQIFYRWRVFLLRAFGAQIGENVIIRPSVRITYPWKVIIGDHTWIGDRVELYSLETIKIGNNTCISQDCYLCTGSHDYLHVNFPYACAPINIGNSVWLAAGCFVGPGITVGNATVLGARSLVLKNLQEKSLYAGHPARFLGPRVMKKV